MRTVRLRDVGTACAKAVNLCYPDSSGRLVDYINRAQERLLYAGKWKGTYQAYRVCLSQACIAWPREIEAIEALAICDTPGTVRNEWYEFLSGGPGIINEESNIAGSLIDRGEKPVFDEVLGTGKKLAVYADKTEINKYITLQFYNTFGQWVRSIFNGEWIDGERIAIPAAGNYNYTANQCLAGGIVRVFKDETVGTVRLYEYTVANGNLKPLGYYQPDELVPAYRWSLIPCLHGDSSSSTCSTTHVTVVGKLRFIPVAEDDDFLMISHREAIRLACKAVKKEEDELLGEAVEFWAMAEKCLSDQVEHYHGAGEKAVVQMAPRWVWGGGIEQVY